MFWIKVFYLSRLLPLCCVRSQAKKNSKKQKHLSVSLKIDKKNLISFSWWCKEVNSLLFPIPHVFVRCRSLVGDARAKAPLRSLLTVLTHICSQTLIEDDFDAGRRKKNFELLNRIRGKNIWPDVLHNSAKNNCLGKKREAHVSWTAGFLVFF